MGCTYQWLFGRIFTRLEEPEEHVGGRVETDVAGIIVDTFGSLTNSRLPGLLVANLGTLGRLDGCDASGIRRGLALSDEWLVSMTERRCCQDGSDLGEARHGEKLVVKKNDQGLRSGLAEKVASLGLLKYSECVRS